MQGTPPADRIQAVPERGRTQKPGPSHAKRASDSATKAGKARLMGSKDFATGSGLVAINGLCAYTHANDGVPSR